MSDSLMVYPLIFSGSRYESRSSKFRLELVGRKIEDSQIYYGTEMLIVEVIIEESFVGHTFVSLIFNKFIQ